MFEKLSRDDVKRIGILLSKRHPELDPLETSLTDLHRYVVDLFEEKELEAIRDAWNKECLDRTLPG